MHNKVRYRCLFDPVEITSNVRHQVEFFEGANNRLAHAIILKGSEREAIMENSEEMKFILGNEVFSITELSSSFIVRFIKFSNKKETKRKTRKILSILFVSCLEWIVVSTQNDVHYIYITR